jgi:hypothetical protein
LAAGASPRSAFRSGTSATPAYSTSPAREVCFFVTEKPVLCRQSKLTACLHVGSRNRRLVGVEGRDERCVDALRNEAAKLGCGSVTSISISVPQPSLAASFRRASTHRSSRPSTPTSPSTSTPSSAFRSGTSATPAYSQADETLGIVSESPASVGQ